MATREEITVKITNNILAKTPQDQITPEGVAEILTDIMNLIPDEVTTLSGNTLTLPDGQSIVIEPDTKATINSGVITFADGQTADIGSIDTDTFATILNGVITTPDGVQHPYSENDTFATFDGNTQITFEDGQVLNLSELTPDVVWGFGNFDPNGMEDPSGEAVIVDQSVTDLINNNLGKKILWIGAYTGVDGYNFGLHILKYVVNDPNEPSQNYWETILEPTPQVFQLIREITTLDNFSQPANQYNYRSSSLNDNETGVHTLDTNVTLNLIESGDNLDPFGNITIQKRDIINSGNGSITFVSENTNSANISNVFVPSGKVARISGKGIVKITHTHDVESDTSTYVLSGDLDDEDLFVASNQRASVTLTDTELNAFDGSESSNITIVPAQAGQIIIVKNIVVERLLNTPVQQSYSNLFIGYDLQAFGYPLDLMTLDISQTNDLIISEGANVGFNQEGNLLDEQPINAPLVVRSTDGINLSGMTGEIHITVEYELYTAKKTS